VHDQPQPTEEEQERQAPDPRHADEEDMRGADPRSDPDDDEET
jgi:hypothetical protein